MTRIDRSPAAPPKMRLLPCSPSAVYEGKKAMHHKCKGKYLVLGLPVAASSRRRRLFWRRLQRRHQDPWALRSVGVALSLRITPSASRTSPSTPRCLPGYGGTSRRNGHNGYGVSA